MDLNVKYTTISGKVDPVLEKFVEDFDINSIPLRTLNEWYRDYEPDYIILQDLDAYDDALCEGYEKKRFSDTPEHCTTSCQEMVEFFVENFKMDEKMFNVREINGTQSLYVKDIPEFWISGIATIIPNIKHNIDIIDENMLNSGYTRVMTKLKGDTIGRKWYHVIYNPVKQPDIKHMLTDRTLLHFSPDFNYDSIMQNGLQLSKGNDLYKYPSPRLFLYSTKYGQLSNWFKNMMCSHSRKIKQTHPAFDGTFNRYCIKKDVISDYEFFWDPNAKDCVFVEKAIPVAALYGAEEVIFPPY